MMELSELAKEAVNTLVPFLAVGGKEVIKGAAADLWGQIKWVFHKKGEEKLMQEFEASPTDQILKTKVEAALEHELNANADLVNSLAQLIGSVQATEDYKAYVKQIGDNNISVTGKITNSTINIHR